MMKVREREKETSLTTWRPMRMKETVDEMACAEFVSCVKKYNSSNTRSIRIMVSTIPNLLFSLPNLSLSLHLLPFYHSLFIFHLPPCSVYLLAFIESVYVCYSFTLFRNQHNCLIESKDYHYFCDIE